MIERRELGVTLGACAMTAPFRAVAQQAQKVWRSGLLHIGAGRCRRYARSAQQLNPPGAPAA